MRKALLLVLSLFICLSFSSRIDKLLGKWYIEKIVFEGREDKERAKFLEFLKDGTLKGGVKGEEASRTGEWNYNEKNRILTLMSNPKRHDDGEYEVLKLTDDILILGVLKDNKTVKVHLKKAE